MGKILSQPYDQAEHELDAATNGQVLRAGTVLDTSGGPPDNNFDSANVTIDSADGNGCRQPTTREQPY
jgi:hypothetical protein